jgi:hypothetical protein
MSIEVSRLRDRLFKNPEFCARQIYEVLMDQSDEGIEYFIMLYEDSPRIKGIKGNSSLENLSGDDLTNNI